MTKTTKNRFFFNATLSLAACLLIGCSSSTDVSEVGTTSDTASDSGSTSSTTKLVSAAPEYINGLWADDNVVSASLKVGDRAPAVHTAAWLIGNPLKGFRSDKVHVVEFWATWCGPCIAGMPHLSELAEEHGDAVQFVGITAEDERTAQQFLKGPSGIDSSKSWADTLKYSLACDDDRRTNAAYMQAAKRSGIPCAFIVSREGFVEWIGHPGTIDQPLQKVLDGTWDRKSYLRAEAAMQEYQIAFHKKDFDTALKKLNVFAEASGEDVSPIRIGLLAELGRFDEAKKVITKVKEDNWNNPEVMNGVAWMITNDLPDELVDLELALACAVQGNELTEYKGFSELETLAQVHFLRDELEDAIKWQTKAIENAPRDPRLQDNFSTTLQKYRAALGRRKAEADGK